MHMSLARAGALAVAVAACSIAACNKTPTTPSGGNGPSPPAAGSTVKYTAVGASDAVGVGASVMCVPFTDCPDGTGYVPDIVRQLKAAGFTVSLMNLGIPGAVIGPDIQAIAAANGNTSAMNFIDAEMPFVPKDSTVVTIFAGGNDARTIGEAVNRGAGGSNPSAYIDSQVQAFAADYRTLLNGVRSRAGNTWIVVANLPNLAGVPFAAGYTGAQKSYLQQVSVGVTRAVNALTSQSVTVVDLMCDARSYQGSIYSPDGFHPNDTGYSYIASKFLDAIRSSGHPAPAATCAQMTLVP
jgi:lysophospholipase L1-like esterase